MTTNYNKLTFGVHLTATTTLTIGTGPKGPMPQMTALSSSGTDYKDYDDVAENWPFTLNAGDYVVQLVVPETHWFDTSLVISASSTVTFVYYDSTSGLVPWSASSATGNPKDPWPPPVVQDPPPSLPTGSASWLTTNLAAARAAELSPERSAQL